jgi:hypothetical protein
MVFLQVYELEVIGHIRTREEPWKGDSARRTTVVLAMMQCKVQNASNMVAESRVKEETHHGDAKE